MVNTGLITIIVPVFNVGSYFERCIESIISQTYTNLQILLIDDGSLDDSGGLCDKYASIDNRIEVIHQKNQGASISRNVGLQNSKGDYIGFVDGDDWCEPEMFESMLHALIEHNVDAVRCNFYEVRNNIKTKYISAPSLRKISGREAISDSLVHSKHSGYETVVWNTLFKSEVFRAPDLLLFNPNLKVGEDGDVLRRSFLRCKSVLLLCECYYNYNVDNVNSLMHSSSLSCKVKSSDCLIEFLKDNDFSKDEIENAYRRKISQLILFEILEFMNKDIVSTNTIDTTKVLDVFSLFDGPVFSRLKCMIVVLMIKMRMPKRSVKIIWDMHK